MVVGSAMGAPTSHTVLLGEAADVRLHCVRLKVLLFVLGRQQLPHERRMR